MIRAARKDALRDSVDKPMRILVAPQDVAAGQMHLLVESLRSKGHGAVSVNYYSEARDYDQQSDINLGLISGSRTPKRAATVLKFAAGAALKYDVFHFFYGESLLPGLWDLPVLKRLGKKIFVHFRGSDIRQLKYLNEVTRRRIQGLPEATDVPPSNPEQMRRLAIWRKRANGIFVSIPELLPLVPEATLVQQTINLAQWDYCPENAGVPPREVVIAHATRTRDVKGTEYVEEAVETLKTRGYPVRLMLIENLPHAQCRELYKTCHIGVDEILQGSYGNFSIELMALGKPVVAYLAPWYQEGRPDLPIVNATPLNLVDQLQALVEDQQRRIELGRLGRAYVERWHEVDRVVDRLISIYRQ